MNLITLRRLLHSSTLFFALISSSALAGTIYQHDDGTVEGASDPLPGSTLVMMNRYRVVAGAETITGLQIGWSWSVSALPTVHNVYLWTDPSNDGDPSDAIIARSLSTAVSLVGLDNEVASYPIAPIALPVGSYFYVGVADYKEAPGNILYTAKEDDSTSGNSFIFYFSGADLTGGFDLSAADVVWIENRTFLYRAEAAAAVPEPGAVTLVGAAIGLALIARRRSR